MILITGGTSFNSSHFIKNIDEDLIVLLNKTKPKILQDNIIYFENLKKFKKSEFRKEVKTIINFASSYNTKNDLIPNFKSSFALLLKLFRMTRNMKLETIIMKCLLSFSKKNLKEKLILDLDYLMIL